MPSQRIDFEDLDGYQGFACYEDMQVTQLAVRVHDATMPEYSQRWRWVYLVDEANQIDLVFLRLRIEASLIYGYVG